MASDTDSGRIVVERATQEDASDILAMERELAEFCGYPLANFRLTSEHLEDRISDPDRSALFIARNVDGNVGFALCHIIPLGWSGSAGVYVEDIFVRESYRSHSIGRALMREVVRLALSLAATAGDPSAAYVRLDSAHDLSQSSHAFFKHIGLVAENENYRMAGEALRALLA